jgi:hypothetical protein
MMSGSYQAEIGSFRFLGLEFRRPEGEAERSEL